MVTIAAPKPKHPWILDLQDLVDQTKIDALVALVEDKRSKLNRKLGRIVPGCIALLVLVGVMAGLAFDLKPSDVFKALNATLALELAATAWAVKKISVLSADEVFAVLQQNVTNDTFAAIKRDAGDPGDFQPWVTWIGAVAVFVLVFVGFLFPDPTPTPPSVLPK